ncbi:MAG: hypothetical protein GYA14_08690 [Ignavibacteria bacterium]|nr:hypothetical protein [Ignavibacteria bacterium]
MKMRMGVQGSMLNINRADAGFDSPPPPPTFYAMRRESDTNPTKSDLILPYIISLLINCMVTSDYNR